MTTAENPDTIPTSQRPLGFWLKVIDRKITASMRAVFTEHGIDRRDWRRLNVIARGTGDSSFAARLAHRPEKVAPLIDRGWVEGDDGAWTLTDAGQTTYDQLLTQVTDIRAQVAGSVSAEDFATTMASLEAIARGLGYTDDEPMRLRRSHGNHSNRGQRRNHRGRRHGRCRPEHD